MKWEQLKPLLDQIEKEAINYDPIRAAAQDYFAFSDLLLKMPHNDLDVYVDHFLKPLEPERYSVGSRRTSGSSAHIRRNGRVR